MIKILYQDDDIVVCEKPVGVLSQCDGSDDMPSLLSRQLGGQIYPVHRLDRNVGGVMVFARTAKAAAALSSQIQNGAFVKRYLAAVQGIPQPQAGEMRDWLFKDSHSGKSFAVNRSRKGTKEARLAYETLETVDGKSLVLVRLFTGRTHQIRVQFASRQMPLLGDGKYGSRDKNSEIALWSYSIAFFHPVTSVPMCFHSLPECGGYPWKMYALHKNPPVSGIRD